MNINKDNEKKMYARADCVVELERGFIFTKDNVDRLFGGARRLLGSTKFGGYEDIFDCTTDIGVDWEQRRYEIAKDVLVALVSENNPTYTKEGLATKSIAFADALISKLKK